MKILVVAPQPFYVQRGTPIAVRLLLETLAELGHEVDCLTVPFGEDPHIEGVRIFRCARPWGVHGLPIGFSLAKLACDASIGFSLLRRVARTRYDVIHANEESAYLAGIVKILRGTPYVYDMDSSLAEQLQESHPEVMPFRRLLHACESLAIRNSIAVTAVCPSLGATAQRSKRSDRVHVIEDIAFESEAPTDTDLRAETGGSAPLLLYVGNLEIYQGIELLLHAFVRMREAIPEARLAVVGGSAESIREAAQRARQLGDDGAAHFLGPRPLKELPALLAQADILVSPRLTGRNTPMKIYSYLASGVPVVATSIESHTQVVDEQTSFLAAPEAEPFGKSLVQAWQQREDALARAARAQELVQAEYTASAFRRKLDAFYRMIAEVLERA